MDKTDNIYKKIQLFNPHIKDKNDTIYQKADEVDLYLRSDKDPLNKTILRYNGFWNDIGEALKAFLPKPIYYGSYFVTSAYACASVYYTNRRLYDEYLKKIKEQTKYAQDSIPYTTDVKSNDDEKKMITTNTIDNAIWHFFATITLTPLAIIGIKRSTRVMTNIVLPRMSDKFKKNVIPSTIGVLSIPLIVPLVDNSVTFTMNHFRYQPQPYHWTGLYKKWNKH